MWKWQAGATGEMTVEADLPDAVDAAELPLEVQTLVTQRSLARGKKDWATADSLRDRLESMGFLVRHLTVHDATSPTGSHNAACLAIIFSRRRRAATGG